MSESNNFEFSIGQEVEIICSGETGKVVGQAHWATSENSFFIRYRGSDGRGVEAWWTASALKANS